MRKVSPSFVTGDYFLWLSLINKVFNNLKEFSYFCTVIVTEILIEFFYMIRPAGEFYL